MSHAELRKVQPYAQVSMLYGSMGVWECGRVFPPYPHTPIPPYNRQERLHGSVSEFPDTEDRIPLAS